MNIGVLTYLYFYDLGVYNIKHPPRSTSQPASQRAWWKMKFRDLRKNGFTGDISFAIIRLVSEDISEGNRDE